VDARNPFRCDAKEYERHDCDDPAGCAIDRLINSDNPTEAELERLHVLLDEIEALTHGRKTLSSEGVLTMIHAKRGGPR